MIKHQLFFFFMRWIFSSFGMWICITLFGQIVGPYDVSLFIISGLVFSLINSFVKPFVTAMALPLIIFTLGAFTLIVNTAMVALAIWLLPNVSMGFGGAVLSSLVMSIVNSLVNFATPPYNNK